MCSKKILYISPYRLLGDLMLLASAIYLSVAAFIPKRFSLFPNHLGFSALNHEFRLPLFNEPISYSQQPIPEHQGFGYI